MTKAAQPLAVRLNELATAYFGDEWHLPVSHFTGVNARTLQRIRQVARQGREHSAARGAIHALTDAAHAFQAAAMKIKSSASHDL